MNTTYQIYHIYGGENYADYGFLSFENHGNGKEVLEFCEKQLDGKNSVTVEMGDGEEYGIRKVHTTHDADAFLRSRGFQDYDSSKHEQLVIEGEIIGNMK